jgi:hypothetical protein
MPNRSRSGEDAHNRQISLPPERPGHRRRRHVLEVAFDATPSTIRLGLVPDGVAG